MVDKLAGAKVALVDATGRKRAAAEQTGIATACLELHGAGPDTSPAVFEIQLTVNANTYPFVVLDGSIGGGICRVIGTSWTVTDGSFGPHLSIEAKRIPLPNAPADAEALLSGPCRSDYSKRPAGRDHADTSVAPDTDRRRKKRKVDVPCNLARDSPTGTAARTPRRFQNCCATAESTGLQWPLRPDSSAW